MATLEKTRGNMMQTEATNTNGKRGQPSGASDYRRDQPRILTEDFAHELAIANRAQRAQRCPWLERNLARLSQIDLGTGSVVNAVANAAAKHRKDGATARPAK